MVKKINTETQKEEYPFNKYLNKTNRRPLIAVLRGFDYPSDYVFENVPKKKYKKYVSPLSDLELALLRLEHGKYAYTG